MTYLGSVYGTQAALRRMRPRNRGVIVQVGSALSRRGIPLQASYCGAKHALKGFLDSLRVELLHDKSQVRVALVQLPGLNTPQFGWVRTDLRRHPQPVPPIYQPEVAARAIAWAAEHPKRELWVGLPTVYTILGEKFASGLMDRFLARTNVEAQQTDTPIVPSHRDDNLQSPPPGDPGAHGRFDDKAKARSPQLWLATHKRALAGAAAGAAALGTAALRRRAALRPRAMRTGPTSDLWWKNAIVYCLDVETFHDADGDGCGDLAGLIERVDHAARLGATCLWLMPFYPTPNRDDGYDIADYLAVDPRLGDLGDVLDAIRHARDRGLRVIVDLVVNHTSDEHPWFRAARADRSSPFRDYYVWSDDPAAEKGDDARQVDLGRGGRAVLQPQLRALPARPEHRQSRRPRRDREDRRLLADAGRLGLPDGRRALPRRGGRRRAASTPTRASAGCTPCASTRCAGPARRC